jgi:hypothetical protein
MIVVTTNGTISPKGLVMGRGAAKEAALLDPDLPRRAADVILHKEYPYKIRDAWVYGFCHPGSVFVPGHDLPKPIGLFQVKFHYHEKANLILMGYSFIRMHVWLQKNPLVLTVAMNYPGIGNGGLVPRQVKPLLE